MPDLSSIIYYKNYQKNLPKSLVMVELKLKMQGLLYIIIYYISPT